MDDIVRSEIVELNEEGKCTYYMDSSGYECWRDYNENGNLVHLKNSKDYEIWFKYDKNNILIYSRHVDGILVTEYRRRKKGEVYNVIYKRDAYENEFWSEWDEKSDVVYHRDNGGGINSERWYRYDSERKFTEITKKEFEHIKFLGRKEISRFKLMEVEE